MWLIMFVTLLGAMGGCALSVIFFVRGTESASLIVDTRRVIGLACLNMLIGVFLLIVCLQCAPDHRGVEGLIIWLMFMILPLSSFWGYGVGLLSVYLNKCPGVSGTAATSVMYGLQSTAEVERLSNELGSSWRRDMLYPAMDELKEQLGVLLAPVVTIEPEKLGRIKILRRWGQIVVTSNNPAQLQQLPPQLHVQELCFERAPL